MHYGRFFDITSKLKFQNGGFNEIEISIALAIGLIYIYLNGTDFKNITY